MKCKIKNRSIALLLGCALMLQVPLMSQAESAAPVLDENIADIDLVLEMMEPASCYVDVDPYMGSGFIIDAGDLYLYVVTNKHVANRNLENAYVIFWDNMEVDAELIYRGMNNDVAFYRVEKAKLPEFTLESLFIVNRRRSEDPLQEDETIGIAAKNTDATYYTTSGTVRDLSYDCYFSGEGTVEGLLSDYSSKGGTSGSAVLDDQGYLVGIHKGTTGDGYAFFLSAEVVYDEYAKARRQDKEIATLIERE